MAASNLCAGASSLAKIDLPRMGDDLLLPQSLMEPIPHPLGIGDFSTIYADGLGRSRLSTNLETARPDLQAGSLWSTPRNTEHRQPRDSPLSNLLSEAEICIRRAGRRPPIHRRQSIRPSIDCGPERWSRDG
jgi:hypothetical protein